MNPHLEAHRALTVGRWKQMVADYQQPDTRASVWQLTNTFLGLFGSWVLMYNALRVGLWLTLILAIPAGGFLVRLFIIQHDCGHGSFFRSRQANDRVGKLCGAFTLVPYALWRRSHAIHHAHSADLGDRGVGDIWTLTVREYLEAPRVKRLAYRIFRNPFFLFGIAPSVLFLILHRFPPRDRSHYNRAERRSVMETNLAILALAGLAYAFFGWQALVLVYLPTAIIGASVGTWMFYVQHQFEDTYWEYKPAWDYTVAALSGSTYYHLPRVLQWFTGNIGFHHIHHLSPRIPNYRLEQCYRDHPEFQEVVELSLRSSLKTVFLALWDEEEKRLVRFRELGRIQARGAAA